MRDLTKDEIDDAPEWAITYAIDNDGYILWLGDKTGLSTNPNNSSFCMGPAKPIPRKEFDILEYDWSDVRAVYSFDIYTDGVEFDLNSHGLALSKQDAIALAKHFKLTPSDLS